MVRLRRTVRFSLLPPTAGDGWSTPRHNAYAGWPTTAGIAAYGGQFEGRPADPPVLVAEASRRLAGELPVPLAALAWRLTPTAFVEYRPAMPSVVELAQSFEFSASHRLHCPEFDDSTNRRIFGKCNNPEGHGHNYRLDVAVAVPLDAPPAGQPGFGLMRLEAIVDQVVVQRFDHRHLNRDCPEFASTNPSVEHIARTCHDLLAEPIRAAGAELRRVTVWETEKTRCTYPG